MNNSESYQAIHAFIEHNYRHFNAAVVRDAARAYVEHLKAGGKMMITLAGAMSTAELGITLSDMIRHGKVHAICCTGANLEEDVFNLIAHDHYLRVPHYRCLSATDEEAFLRRGLNRVTDTCIPEEEAMRVLEKKLIALWQKAEREEKNYFPYENIYQILDTEMPASDYHVSPRQSWTLAAKEMRIPIFVPGWEDSSMGNVFVAAKMRGLISNFRVVKSGLDTMEHLVRWYKEHSCQSRIGFYQIGGGIAGMMAALNASEHGAKVVGVWHTDVGESNEIIYILGFKDFAQREKFWDDFRRDPVFIDYQKGGTRSSSVVNKILRPTDYSPLK